MKLNKTLKASAIFIMLALSVLLISCGDKSQQYKDDVSVDEIITKLDAKVENSNLLTPLDDYYMESLLGIDVKNSAIESYAVKTQTGGSEIDEYGVFKVKPDATIEEIEKSIKEYFSRRIDTWNPDYLADQKVKVESAEYKIAGDYLVYAMLSGDERKDVFDAFELMLKK